MRTELSKALGMLLQTAPQASALLYGSDKFPDIHGTVYFYPFWDGTLVAAEAAGLPFMEGSCTEKIFGFHIHEGEQCQGTKEDPFADAGTHYNPQHCQHPQHAGDLPPLFGCGGYAMQLFYTNRFLPHELKGHTVIVHSMPDDFKTQPSGNSGKKIACGVIQVNEPYEQD
ncbi:MAG: superoxide dismutase family protein [Candidatus Limivivens sp.]|nr:superoxide dismutase family protein [Candidatus Limivivens sp.]